MIYIVELRPHKKRIELEAWWLRYSRDVEEYKKICKNCEKWRYYTQTTLYSWPREAKPCSREHMDNVYITGVELLLILVDSFSSWPEIIYVPENNISTIKHILRVIFSRNRIPKTLVSDNAPGFCDKDLNLLLQK